MAYNHNCCQFLLAPKSCAKHAWNAFILVLVILLTRFWAVKSAMGLLPVSKPVRKLLEGIH